MGEVIPKSLLGNTSLEGQRLGDYSQYCGTGNTGQKLSSNYERQ